MQRSTGRDGSRAEAGVAETRLPRALARKTGDQRGLTLENVRSSAVGPVTTPLSSAISARPQIGEKKKKKKRTAREEQHRDIAVRERETGHTITARTRRNRPPRHLRHKREQTQAQGLQTMENLGCRAPQPAVPHTSVHWQREGIGTQAHTTRLWRTPAPGSSRPMPRPSCRSFQPFIPLCRPVNLCHVCNGVVLVQLEQYGFLPNPQPAAQLVAEGSSPTTRHKRRERDQGRCNAHGRVLLRDFTASSPTPLGSRTSSRSLG